MRIAENERGQLRLYLITLVLIAGSLGLISCVTPGEPVIEETAAETTADTATDPFAGEDPDIWARDPLSGDLTWFPENVIFPGQREFLEVGSTELYDDLGLDVSVEYNSSILPLWITTFFYLQDYYPENNLQDHFVSVLNDIYYAWGDNSELLDAQELTFTYAGQTAVDGYYALVKYEQGPDDGDWGGIAVLFPYGDYYFMSRMSFLGVDDSDIVDAAWSILVDLLESMTIPPPLENTTGNK